MPETYREVEKRVINAVQSLQSNPELSIADAAREHDERALIQIITRLNETGLPPKIKVIKAFANSLISRDHTHLPPVLPEGRMYDPNDPPLPPPVIGTSWVYRFTHGHEGLRVTTSQPLAIDRTQSHNHLDIRDWYGRFLAEIDSKGVLLSDTYNVDQTAFQVGCGKRQKVVTTQPKGKTTKVYQPDPNDRDHVTLTECISTDGHVIAPQVILKGKILLDKYIVRELPSDYKIAMSESGYSNDDLAFTWLKHFDLHTKRRQIGKWRLLLMDGWECSFTHEFITFAWDNNIIPFSLPPHTTHIMQPLDVGCFQPYKHWHAEAVQEVVYVGSLDFSKVDFPEKLSSIRSKTFKEKTIRDSWRRCGFYPRNIELVLEKLADYRVWRDRHREITPELELPTEFETPTDHQRFIDAVRLQMIKLKDPKIRNSPNFFIRCEKIARAGIILAHTGEQAIKQLAEHSTEQKKRKSRNNSQKHLSKGGAIKVSEGRELRSIRATAEAEKAKRKRQKTLDEAAMKARWATARLLQEEGDNEVTDNEGEGVGQQGKRSKEGGSKVASAPPMQAMMTSFQI